MKQEAIVETECTSDARPDSHVKDTEDHKYPLGIRLWMINTAINLGGFLVALDGNALGPAIAVISDEFHSLGDIGWYNSVYFMTLSAPQLLFSKLNERYPIRWVYSASLSIFVVGSALCGAAPNSPILILGRAIAGLGAAGMLASTAALLPFLAPPAKRPLWFGLYAASMGLGSSSGPLIAGVLTQRVSWRWNASPHPQPIHFYINVPIGAFLCGVCLLLVHPPVPVVTTSWIEFLQYLDLFGLAALVAAVVCMMLALQMGGAVYAWDSGCIIALFVLFLVFMLVFIGNEVHQGDKAIVPVRILSQRTILFTMLFAFCTNGAPVAATYYLPVWFQGVKEFSPLHSSVASLPQVISSITGSIFSGVIITLFGHTGTMMVVASVFAILGAGLLTTLSPDSASGKWIGYQIFVGLGSGIGRQTPVVCVQQVLASKDIPIGYTIMTFAQFLSPAISVPIAQAVFDNTLISGLAELGIAQLKPSAAVLAGGVGMLTDGLSAAAKTSVLGVVSESVVHSWQVCLGLCCISIIGALAVEHRKLVTKGSG
ncbi:major facilitator superfamily domain-containing protein [Xylariales sp. PMI_506]|nr:major facilitator superfamily domain-containing protein [Xylariales sp. PMI_506]